MFLFKRVCEMHFAGAMGGVSLENTYREPETSVRTTVTSCHSLALAQVIGNACPQSPAIDSVNRAGAGLRHKGKLVCISTQTSKRPLEKTPTATAACNSKSLHKQKI